MKRSFHILSKEEVDAKFEYIKSLCNESLSYEDASQIVRSSFNFRLFPYTGLPSGQNVFTVFRVTEKSTRDCNIPQTFSFNPCPDKIGRAHIPGYPVFYGATNVATAFREMKEKLKPNESFFVSEWIIPFQKGINFHPLLSSSQKSDKSAFASEIIERLLERSIDGLQLRNSDEKECIRHYLLRMGDLFTLQDPKYYPITSAYAHELFYQLGPSEIDIPILVYPSVESDYKMPNFAIHPSLIENGLMRLNRVIEVEMQEIGKEKMNIVYNRKGVNIDGVIHWLQSIIHIERIFYDDIVFQSKKGNSDYVLQTSIPESIKKEIFKGVVSELKNMTDQDVENDENELFEISSSEYFEVVKILLDQPQTGKFSEDFDQLVSFTVPVKWRASFTSSNS